MGWKSRHGSQVYQWSSCNRCPDNGDCRDGSRKSKQRACYPCGIPWSTGCWYQWKRRLKCKKKYSNGEDIGFVGDITEVNPKILYDLLEKDFLPIVFPIGFDDNYDSYNINADDAACAIAEAVHAEKLAFLSDIEGVYKDKDDPSSLISELHIQDARKLIEDGYVGGGMIPKLNNCIEAIEHGVNRVHILDGRIPHSLLLEIFTNKGIGTAILREDGEEYYHEHE